jgi:hypothetical protein
VTYGFLSFLVVLPWYLKSWVLAGNPVWPFLDGFFQSRNWDGPAQENLIRFIQSANFPLTVRNWLTGIWKLTRYPDTFGSNRYDLGWSYLLLALPMLLVFRSGFGTVKRKFFFYLGGIFLGMYSVWFVTTHQTRFLLPSMPIMALMIAAGLQSAYDATERPWLRNAIVISLLLILIGNHWTASPTDRTTVRGNLPYLLGEVNRDEYLQNHFEGYSVYQYLNKELPEEAQLLLGLFEVRGYYLERRYFWLNPVAQRVYRLEEFHSSEELKDRLVFDGFTHLLYNPRYEETLSELEQGEKIRSIFEQLLSRSRLLFEDRGIQLYQLALD